MGFKTDGQLLRAGIAGKSNSNTGGCFKVGRINKDISTLNQYKLYLFTVKYSQSSNFKNIENEDTYRYSSTDINALSLYKFELINDLKVKYGPYNTSGDPKNPLYRFSRILNHGYGPIELATVSSTVYIMTNTESNSIKKEFYNTKTNEWE